ncbi:MAG: rhomboid family intramembrane serine protease [Acidimicrobiales bacterium]
MAAGLEDSQRSLPARIFLSGFGLLLAWVAVLWGVEIVDSFLLDDRMQRNGIHPRDTSGLDGILWSPWLHSDFGHVLSNTVPFIVLGWLTMLRGVRFWLAVTVATMIGGGGLVWLLAGGSNHIGASGLVFGYFGALMGAAIRSRRPATMAPALVAIFLYGTILVGVVPQDDISWEGHLFGMIVGFIVAFRLVARPEPKADPEDYLYPWEIDEPWRTQDG